jgi:hypothetical protein
MQRGSIEVESAEVARLLQVADYLDMPSIVKILLRGITKENGRDVLSVVRSRYLERIRPIALYKEGMRLILICQAT